MRPSFNSRKALVRRWRGWVHRARRLSARAVEPRGVAARIEPRSVPAVEVFIASFNTRDATELTIRSLLASDSSSYRIRVGDGGSTDGSVELLQGLAGAGLIDVELRSD